MGIGASYEIMLVRVKKYRQFAPKRDFLLNFFLEKVEFKTLIFLSKNAKIFWF